MVFMNRKPIRWYFWAWFANACYSIRWRFLKLGWRLWPGVDSPEWFSSITGFFDSGYYRNLNKLIRQTDFNLYGQRRTWDGK